MLNFFLVLGQVPGTNIQLTLSEILLFCLTVFVWLFFHVHRAAQPEPRPRPTIWESLVNYETPAFRLPVVSTQRTIAVQTIDNWLLWLDRRWRIVR